jgi:hypothetical protein
MNTVVGHTRQPRLGAGLITAPQRLSGPAYSWAVT